ncbi:MAG: alkaline phosphatase family protein [Candidatus Sulfotelmatobacter sp.]
MGVLRRFLLLLISCGPCFAQGSVSHWVFIIMENRSFDDTFGQLPPLPDGTFVNGSSTGTCGGTTGALYHMNAGVAEGDIPHAYSNSQTDIASGAMNGFPAPTGTCGTNFAICPCSYFNGGDIPWYYSMAHTFGIADMAFQPNSGPSMPSHLYAIAGKSGAPATGTANVTNGSATVTRASGFYFDGSWANLLITLGSGTYTVSSVTNNTTLVLSTNYGGSTGTASYSINFAGIVDNPVSLYEIPNLWDCYANTPAGACTATGCTYVDADNVTPLVNNLNTTGALNQFHSGECSSTCSGGTNSGNICFQSSDCPGGSCAVTTITACTDLASNTTTCGSNTCTTTRCLQGTVGCTCPQITTLFDELTTASISHKWYGPTSGSTAQAGTHYFGELWEAPFYFPSGAFGAENTNVVATKQFFTDVANTAQITAWSITSNVVTFTAKNSYTAGTPLTLTDFPTSTFFNNQTVTVLSTGLSGTQFEVNFTHSNGSGTEIGTASGLPAVSYISPTIQLSEHPVNDFDVTQTMHAGESWNSQLVQAIFSQPLLYNHTAIFITWDDWGGFYDHVNPLTYAIDNIGPGIRVPLLCIGPYCKNTVTHTVFSTTDSILACLISKYGLPNLGPRTTGRSVCDSTSGMLNLSQKPIPAPSSSPQHNLIVEGREPDVVDAVRWVWGRLFPRLQEEQEFHPVLAKRECLDGTVPEKRIYKPTQEEIVVCALYRNGHLVAYERPGESVDDIEDYDRKTTKRGR